MRAKQQVQLPQDERRGSSHWSGLQKALQKSWIFGLSNKNSTSHRNRARLGPGNAHAQRLDRFATRFPRLYHLLLEWPVCLLPLAFVSLVASLGPLLIGLFGPQQSSLPASWWALITAVAYIPSWALLWFIWLRTADKQAPPSGYRISHKVAPELFKLIEQLCRELNAYKPTSVLLVTHYVVGTHRRLRRGLILDHDATLLVGLPTLQTLSPLHFKAALTHALAQLRKNPGNSQSRVTRLREIWAQHQQTTSKTKNPLVLPWRLFINLYQPWCEAVTFRSARCEVLNLDSLTADIIGRQRFAEMLTARVVGLSYVRDQFWPGILSRALNEPTPAVRPYSILSKAMGQNLKSDDARRWLTKALNQQILAGSPAPSLEARLTAVGCRVAPLVRPPRLSAAAAVLSPHSDQVVQRFDREWQNMVQLRWRRYHQRAQQERRKIDVYAEKAKQGQLTVHEGIELAKLVSMHLGNGQAANIYKHLLARFSNEVELHFIAGRFLLLSLADESGLKALQRAARLDTSRAAEAQAIIARYREKQKQAARVPKIMVRDDDVDTYSANSPFHNQAAIAVEFHEIPGPDALLKANRQPGS